MDNNKEMIEGLVSQILDDYHKSAGTIFTARQGGCL